MSSGRGRRQKPSKADHQVVPYKTARDRFLAEADKLPEIEWLVAVGRYVQDRWMAEEAVRKPDCDLDETATWGIWDECTEKQIRDLRTEAGTALKAYVRRHWAKALRDMAKQNLKPAKAFLAVGMWLAQALLAGFVGGIGLILLGIVIVKLAPPLADAIKSTLDVNPPAAHAAANPAQH